MTDIPKPELRFELRTDGVTESIWDTRPGSGTVQSRSEQPVKISMADVVKRLNAGEGFRMHFHESKRGAF